MFNEMVRQIKEIAINEAVDICDKSQFMDKTMFYNKIKDMTVQEISQISMDIVLTYNIKEMNKALKVQTGKGKVSSGENILKMIM